MDMISTSTMLILLSSLLLCSYQAETPGEIHSVPAEDDIREIVLRRGGVDCMILRGDEIVLEGVVVGKFEGNQVRKGGSLIGEIRGEAFRHEGSDVWKLDRANYYPGREIRLEGTIIGDIRSDGSIYRDGSTWGAAKPYDASTSETMRIMAALYYFSTYFD